MLRLLAIALLLATAAGCSDGTCDPGQRVSNGLCYPEADAAPTHDSAFAGYGDPCGATADCVAPTDWCALDPGQTVGYCTHTGCKADASVCPPLWSCLDLSVFQAGLPAICTRP